MIYSLKSMRVWFKVEVGDKKGAIAPVLGIKVGKMLSEG